MDFIIGITATRNQTITIAAKSKGIRILLDIRDETKIKQNKTKVIYHIKPQWLHINQFLAFQISLGIHMLLVTNWHLENNLAYLITTENFGTYIRTLWESSKDFKILISTHPDFPKQLTFFPTNHYCLIALLRHMENNQLTAFNVS